jgi:UPF0755 protein
MQKKRAPLFLRLTIWLVLLLLVVGVGGSWYWNSLKQPADSNGETKAFVVQKGETVSDIADRLQKEGIIKSSLVFKFLISQAGVIVGPGDYKLSPAMTPEEIIKNLNQGAVDKWVTFLEGWRVEQVAKQVSDEVGIKKEDFLAVAKGKEGQLFPDTYLFNKDATAQTIVNTLTGNFEKKYDDVIKNKIKSKGLTVDQGLVLASIVEREGRSDQVRTNIASILLKRYKMTMALQADATVQYAKDSLALKNGKPPAKFWQPVTQDDYHDVNSPFNTYLAPGLPPSPICNPSLSSLTAVAQADSSTPYLYYYVDSSGKIYYAKTLDEQNANVASHH